MPTSASDIDHAGVTPTARQDPHHQRGQRQRDHRDEHHTVERVEAAVPPPGHAHRSGHHERPPHDERGARHAEDHQAEEHDPARAAGGADRDALWFMPPLETEGRCGGYAIFDTSAIHVIRRIKELAQPDSEMVPSLVIAPAQLLQVLDDSSVNIALPIQDELAVTPAHLPWAVNA
ncbi:hypothetical protein OG243_07540 [Streptomyces sp. NBC_01318]|uniref:hypothetical protein n=1 Tax=Streptomyces sp. NBC_01318 TaxID=2903823 RepID=UPI002E105248|nr:hypothetical protein OG243_07540 [Streptomyces sp. NBC_01318]